MNEKIANLLKKMNYKLEEMSQYPHPEDNYLYKVFASKSGKYVIWNYNNYSEDFNNGKYINDYLEAKEYYYRSVLEILERWNNQ